MLQRLLEHQKNNTHTTIFRSITEEGQMLSLKASRRILLIYALCFYTELKEPCIYSQLKTNKQKTQVPFEAVLAFIKSC